MATLNNGPKATISGTTLLSTAFIVLKLCKVINWSWIWVLAPVWIPTAVAAIILIAAIIIYNLPADKTDHRGF
jgi:hypothetical protein